MSNARIRRDLPNDEYQAAVGSNNASASNVFATIADLTSGASSASKIVFDVKYDEAGGITKGQAVYVSGANGTNILVKKADYSAEATSSKTLGLVTSSGALNYQGQVIAEGLLSGIDTSAANAEGDAVWLGANGNFVYGLANKPYAPNHMVFIGIVTKKNASTGEIFVKVQNGFELDELHNVDLHTIAPVDGDGLFYDGATGLWKNKAPNSTPAAQTVLFADLATTEALKACTYSNGTLGVGATLTGNANGQLSTVSFTDKIDNVTTALGQVILVQSQTDKKQNGVYVVTQLGDVSTPFILTRSTDADTQAELYPLQINVFSGATLANRAFLQKTVDPVVGTDNIVFTTSAIGLTNTPVRHVDTVTSSALPACTYTSGTNVSLPGYGAYLEANANGALGTINGIALVVGNRILVKDQANQAHNGDYVVSNAGSGSAKWKLVRVSSWGAEFVRLEREWKVNNPSSAKYGARYSTSLSSLASTAVGTTNIVFSEVANAGGRFGIADSAGTYTYYTTLTLAMAAATAGQTIEFFTDFTETGAVTITLKNGVNINGNGHTYNYTNATGNCFIDNGVAVTCVISNLTVVRTNYTSGSIYVQTSTNSDTDWLGSKLYMTANSGYGVQLVGTIRNCWTKITGNGTAIYSAYYSNAKLYSSHGESTGAGTGLDCRTSIVYNSTGISNSGFGGYLDQSKTYNSVFQSTSNYGVQYGGELFSSTIISVSSTALFIGSCYNCTIISTSGSCVACQNNSYYNCTMITSSGNCTNFQSYNHNCVFRTDSNTVTQAYFTPEFYNCSIQTNWNNASGHALVQPGNVVNCYISVANTSANCLYNASPLNVKYANNSFKGATTPVNANVTQAIVNTQDNQGNILL